VSARPSKKPHVHPVDEAWLALGGEPAIGPALEVVDAHSHLWDFSDPPYFADSYVRDAKSAGVSASVYVDCTMGYREDGPEALEPVGEVEFVARQASLAAASGVDVAAAIIGWADLRLGDAAGEVLDALAQAGGPNYRGIRVRANYDPDPQAGYGPQGTAAGLLLRDDFRRGLEQVQSRGLAFDLYAFHTQLHEVADLARAFPDLPIALNHIGGPIGIGRYTSIREEVHAEWLEGMEAVAACPNVSVKVSGFAISRIAIIPTAPRARPFSSAEVADICREWTEPCFRLFGASRCMFGSNFPVDKVALPLRTLINAMKRLSADLGVTGQQRFFADNARTFYRLGQAAPQGI
jgi:predicted TIM-barrel fold metal-dependent hydrolase